MTMPQLTSKAVTMSRIEPIPTTPKEAMVLGLKWYMPTTRCPRGHVSKRNVSNRECRKCVDERSKRNRRENLVIVRSKDRAAYHQRADTKRRQMRASRKKNIEKRRAYDRQRYRENPEKWKKRAITWGRKNKDKRRAYCAMARRIMKKATPIWLTADQRQQIKNLYLEASQHQPTLHVDHIVPLRGKTVCGLHVPWNLQLLSAEENVRKGNKI